MITYEAYIQYGNANNLPMITIKADDVIYAPLWFHLQGLSQTASGYGSKLATEYKLKHNGRLYRVYCAIYSNIGRLYIVSNGIELTVNLNEV